MIDGSEGQIHSPLAILDLRSDHQVKRYTVNGHLEIIGFLKNKD